MGTLPCQGRGTCSGGPRGPPGAVPRVVTCSSSTRLRLVAAPFSTASMLILLSDLVVWYLSGQLLSAGTVCHTVFSVQRNHKSQEQKKCCHARAHR